MPCETPTRHPPLLSHGACCRVPGPDHCPGRGQSGCHTEAHAACHVPCHHCGAALPTPIRVLLVLHGGAAPEQNRRAGCMRCSARNACASSWHAPEAHKGKSVNAVKRQQAGGSRPAVGTAEVAAVHCQSGCGHRRREPVHPPPWHSHRSVHGRLRLRCRAVRLQPPRSAVCISSKILEANRHHGFLPLYTLCRVGQSSK